MRLISTFRILTLVLLCVKRFPRFSQKHQQHPKSCLLLPAMVIREVYIMNPDGSEQVNLTKHPAGDLQAVWSPTGEKILFVSDRGGERDLYLMDPDGSKVRRVFKRKIEAWRTSPTWAPDGQQIAYNQWDRIGGGTSGMYTLTLGEPDPRIHWAVFLLQHGHLTEQKLPAVQRAQE